jgi:hypothetical protein
MRGEPWNPRHEKSDLQRGLEVILAAEAAKEAEKNALANAVARNQDRLADAIEILADNAVAQSEGEPGKRKPGRPRKEPAGA